MTTKEIQEKIAKLNEDRKIHVAAERQKQAETGESTLDTAIMQAVREQAKDASRVSELMGQVNRSVEEIRTGGQEQERGNEAAKLLERRLTQTQAAARAMVGAMGFRYYRAPHGPNPAAAANGRPEYREHYEIVRTAGATDG